MNVNPITVKLSFFVKHLGSNNYRVQIIDSQKQVYATWDVEIPKLGDLTIGPFDFSFRIEHI